MFRTMRSPHRDDQIMHCALNLIPQVPELFLIPSFGRKDVIMQVPIPQMTKAIDAHIAQFFQMVWGQFYEIWDHRKGQ